MSIPTGQLLDVSADGRSMFLFEGTATAAFEVWAGEGKSQYVLTTVTPDDDGNFSALIPYATRVRMNFIHYTQGQADGTNDVLTSVTRVPDYFDTHTSHAYLFANCTALTSVTAKIETGRVTNLSYCFYKCTALVNAPDINMENVTNLSYCFYYCTNLRNIPAYNTGKCTNFSYMFYKCSRLQDGDLPTFDTSSGTNFSNMYAYCNKLTTVPLTDTSKGTNFNSLFHGCASLTDPPSFDTSNGTSFESTFSGCTSLVVCPWYDTSKGTSASNMFYNCSSLTTVPLMDFGNITSLHWTFDGCSSLVSLPEGWNTSKCTNFYRTFSMCQKLVKAPSFDTSKGTLFWSMFSNCKALVEVPAYDLSKGTNCASMFIACTSLTELPAFDFSSATKVEAIYGGCSKLKTVPNLDFPKATALDRIIQGTVINPLPPINAPVATSAYQMAVSYSTGQTIVMNAPNITSYKQAFDGYNNVEGINWQAVTDASYMFYRNARITELSDVDLSHVTSISNMFTSYTKNLTTFGGTFVGPSISFSLSGVPLNHDSLVKVLNGLPEVTDGQTLTLGEALLTKLAEEEIAIGTNKGWTVK